MPDTPCPRPLSASEASFARSFPELADASTAQIREAMAFATRAVVLVRKQQRRNDAMREWLAENQLPLPYGLIEP